MGKWREKVMESEHWKDTREEKKIKTEHEKEGAVTHVCHPSTLGGCGERIAQAWEVKAAVRCDCATALQAG